MAFDYEFFGRTTASGNEKAPIWYSYKSEDDTLATIQASGYFNGLISNLSNGVGGINLGDIIHVQGSDNFGLLRVNSITTAVTTEPYGTAGYAIVFAGRYQTNNALGENMPSPGSLPTDISFAVMNVQDTGNFPNITRVTSSTNTTGVFFDALPGFNTFVYYQVIRPL